jgi:hypothetical protein
MGIQSDRSRSWVRRFAAHVASACAVLTLVFQLALPVFAQNVPEDNLLKRGQGLILDTEDDLANIPRAPDYRAFLPDRVDLSGRFPTPRDQGNQNSCVGWSVAYARAYYANRVEGRDLSEPANIPSPAYIYDSIRETSQQCDSGSKISDGLNLLKRGAVSLKQFPYSEDDCSRPANVVRSKASDFRIANWLLVDTRRIDQVKGALTLGHPVIVSGVGSQTHTISLGRPRGPSRRSRRHRIIIT